jgi:hypothetical protein
MVKRLTHPSLLATVGVGLSLFALSSVSDLPWWLWAAWAVLGAVSVVQAVRSDR